MGVATGRKSHSWILGRLGVEGHRSAVAAWDARSAGFTRQIFATRCNRSSLLRAVLVCFKKYIIISNNISVVIAIVIAVFIAYVIVIVTSINYIIIIVIIFFYLDVLAQDGKAAKRDEAANRGDGNSRGDGDHQRRRGAKDHPRCPQAGAADPRPEAAAAGVG